MRTTLDQKEMRENERKGEKRREKEMKKGRGR
jgi:hypothetical protein